MRKILAVDDDKDTLYTLTVIGKMAGWEMTIASRAAHALDILARDDFNLIIVDYHMPEMDGLALVHSIRKQDQHTPIVVLTVDERMILAEKFLQAGASDFAIKPIKAPDFISRMSLHLTSQTPAQQSPFSILQKWEQDPASLPKGVSITTMALILKELEQKDSTQDGWLGAEEIALRVGIAYQTAWRYLDQLQLENVVEVSHSYGRPGRPKKRYRLLG